MVSYLFYFHLNSFFFFFSFFLFSCHYYFLLRSFGYRLLLSFNFKLLMIFFFSLLLRLFCEGDIKVLQCMKDPARREKEVNIRSMESGTIILLQVDKKCERYIRIAF